MCEEVNKYLLSFICVMAVKFFFKISKNVHFVII